MLPRVLDVNLVYHFVASSETMRHAISTSFLRPLARFLNSSTDQEFHFPAYLERNQQKIPASMKTCLHDRHSLFNNAVSAKVTGDALKKTTENFPTAKRKEN